MVDICAPGVRVSGAVVFLAPNTCLLIMRCVIEMAPVNRREATRLEGWLVVCEVCVLMKVQFNSSFYINKLEGCFCRQGPLGRVVTYE